uniref:Uncharacterized protein n=1 Tax=Tetranychus urticae TaxID=32264 RepID=T1KLR1_TETUR
MSEVDGKVYQKKHVDKDCPHLILVGIKDDHERKNLEVWIPCKPDEIDSIGSSSSNKFPYGAIRIFGLLLLVSLSSYGIYKMVKK